MMKPLGSPDRSSRRSLLALLTGGAASLAALPAFAEGTCLVGPPAHTKGPKVFLDYDQVELDAA